MDMDPCRPKNRDACKDPELKADPDIAGIGVSYHFSQNSLDLLVRFLPATHVV